MCDFPAVGTSARRAESSKLRRQKYYRYASGGGVDHLDLRLEFPPATSCDYLHVSRWQCRVILIEYRRLFLCECRVSARRNSADGVDGGGGKVAAAKERNASA